MMSISVPDGTPEELTETAEAVAGYVTAAGGRILRSSNESPWGRRRLAYPIRHNSTDLRDGFYTLYHFEIEPNRIEDIERELRLNERVIRHLLLVLDSEPIFVEPEEEVTSETNAATGETIVTDETVVVAEAPASGEVEVSDEVEVAAVDATGEVEAVADDVEVAVVDSVGEAEVIDEVEVEAVAEEVDVAVVEAPEDVEAVAEDGEVVKAEEK
jgi:small subunit ribosomal protein S6